MCFLKRLIALVFCALLVAGVFGACSRGSNVSVLYFAVPNTAGSFDPQVAADVTARIVVRNCFEGLVYVNESGAAEPGFASHWDLSEDGCTYTFYLRQNEKWHVTSNAAEALEGKLPEDFAPAVTAADFVFGLRRAVDPATGAPDAGLLANVENADKILAGEAASETLGVSAPDDYTLEIRLTRPQSNFLRVLAEPLCMPCNQTFFEATGGRYGLLIKYSLMNGPFYLSRFDDTSYRIAKNPDYAGSHEPQTDYIWFYKQADEQKLLSSLRSDTYGGAYLSAAGLKALGKDETLSAMPLNDILCCILLNPKTETLQNDDIRAAFFAATDTAAFSAEAGKTPAAHFYPAAIGTGEAAQGSDFNEKRAASLLAEGLEALAVRGVKYTLLCETADENALKKQLQEWQRILGMNFNITVSAVSAAELAAAVEKGEYEMAFVPVTASSFSSYAWFSRFTAGGANSVLPLEDEALSEAVGALAGANDAETDAAFRKAERALAASNYVMPLWEASNYFVCASDIAGVRVLPGSDRLYLFFAEKQ